MDRCYIWGKSSMKKCFWKNYLRSKIMPHGHLCSLLSGRCSDKWTSILLRCYNYFSFISSLYWLTRVLASNRSKKEIKGSHGPPWGRKQKIIRRKNCFDKAPKLFILCLFNPTVNGTWIDQKVQKKLGPPRKTAYMLYPQLVLSR